VIRARTQTSYVIRTNGPQISGVHFCVPGWFQINEVAEYNVCEWMEGGLSCIRIGRVRATTQFG
jgi:hypothetical protein